MENPRLRPSRLRSLAPLALFALVPLVGCKDRGAATKDLLEAAPPLSLPSDQRTAAAAAEAPPAAKGAPQEPAGEVDRPAPRPAADPTGPVADAVPGKGARRRTGNAPGTTSGFPTHDGLRLTRLIVAGGVAGREPVGPATSFAAGAAEKVYAFLEVDNEPMSPQNVVVTFTPPSGPSHRVKLEVGAQKRFRTWAFTRNPRAKGIWTATVSTETGEELGRSSFEIR